MMERLKKTAKEHWRFIMMFLFWLQSTNGEDPVPGVINVIQPVILGRSVTLVFKPFIAVEESSIHWIKQTSYGESTIYESKWNRFRLNQNQDSSEFYLTILNSTFDDAAPYMAEYNGVRSDLVHLTLQEEPSQPTLTSPDHVNKVCSYCIAVKSETVARLDCDVVRGTSPVALKLYLNDTVLDFDPDSRSLSKQVSVNDTMHGLNITCEVFNDALTLPKKIRKQLYVVLPPSPPVLKVDELIKGQPGNVSCESKDTRPQPNAYIFLDSKPKQTEKAVLFDEQTETYSIHVWTNEILEIHNGYYIMCCLSHVTLSKPLCTAQQKIYFRYPPKTLTCETDGPSQLYNTQHYILLVKCVIAESEPLCALAWSSTDTLAYTVGATGQRSQTAILNLTRHDNGKIIQCRAVCQDFPNLQLTHEYTINVPFSPIIEINATERVVLKEGDPVVIQCLVDSNPNPETNWVFSFDSYEERNLTYCGFQHSCILEISSVTKVDSGIYSCVADNKLFNKTARALELIVTESRWSSTKPTTSGTVKEELTKPEDSTNQMTWLGIGIALLALLVLAILVTVAVKKRRQQNKEDKEVTKEKPHSADDPAVYENTIQRDEEDTLSAEYATVIPKALRNKESDLTPKNEHKELVYVELDLEENLSTKESAPVINRKESSTEYAVIEFSQNGKISVNENNLPP